MSIEIEAAIAKLEKLKAESDAKYEWAVGPDDDGIPALVADPEDMNLELFSYHKGSWNYDDPHDPDAANRANAELIVTLKRTIDAQLLILRSVADIKGVPNPIFMLDRFALALADAILGGA